jgi:hypothetical protein
MKYTKKEIKVICGKVRKVKYAEQEYWKEKKNIALHKLSRSENKYQDPDHDDEDYEDMCHENYMAEIREWLKTHPQYEQYEDEDDY